MPLLWHSPMTVLTQYLQYGDYIPYALSRIQRRYYTADEYARVSGLIPVLDSLTEESVVNLARAAEKLMRCMAYSRLSQAWLG